MFSVVEAAEPQPELGVPGDVLSVRARIAADLGMLRKAYAPKLGPTVQLDRRTDYPYRAYITKKAFADAMLKVTLDLDYGSFKSMVAAEQSASRAHLYSEVWSVMQEAESRVKAAERVVQQRRANAVADRKRPPHSKS